MPKIGAVYAEDRVWFNDNDKYVCAWLRNLFPRSTVNRRSITDLIAQDAAGTRCHFFAGIGGWEVALRLAGWPREREVWTGSCPCQPFSVAGKGKAWTDSRHLWPALLGLIAECRPATMFGEQVASKLGLEWVERVRLDLEDEGYAVGIAYLSAAGVGAPFMGDRLYWVASTDRYVCANGIYSRVVERIVYEEARWKEAPNPPANHLHYAHWDTPEKQWADGTTRRCKPGTDLLVDGIPSVALQNRAYGNSIVPQLSAMFIKSFLEAEEMCRK